MKIHKSVVAPIVFVFFLIMFFSPLFAEIKADFPVLVDPCNHSCDNKTTLPDSSHKDKNPVDCSSPCHANSCFVFFGAEASIANAPMFSTKAHVILSEQGNVNEIVARIFKPPQA